MKYMFICLLTLIAMVVILNCDRPSNNIKLEKSQTKYLKPESSKGIILGDKMRYELWYDMNKWWAHNRGSDEFKKFTEGMVNKPGIEYSYIITHSSYEPEVMIDEVRVPVVYEQKYDDMLKTIQMAGGDLISADIRSVNGNDALYMCYGNKEMTTIEYIMSNKTGTVRVHANTSKNKFSEYESDMIDLLNGIVDRSEISDEDFEQQKAIPTSDTYVKKGITHYDKGQYDKAIADYNKAIELNPRYARAYFNRGNAYDDKGQHDKAIAGYNKAIDLNPWYAEAYINRGNAYDGKRQHDKAISDYTKAIEIYPKIAQAYNNRGVSYFFIRDYKKAWDDVHKAESLGFKVHPGFLKALRQASGRQK